MLGNTLLLWECATSYGLSRAEKGWHQEDLMLMSWFFLPWFCGDIKDSEKWSNAKRLNKKLQSNDIQRVQWLRWSLVFFSFPVLRTDFQMKKHHSGSSRTFSTNKSCQTLFPPKNCHVTWTMIKIKFGIWFKQQPPPNFKFCKGVPVKSSPNTSREKGVQLRLAVMHLNGIGTVRNCQLAVDLLKRVWRLGFWLW